VAVREQGQVVDLVMVRIACGPLLYWYERFLSGDRPAIRELDQALAAIRGLAPVGGRVGRAIALLAGNDVRRDTEQVVAALELLVQMPALRTPRSASPVGRRQQPAAPHLPGLDD